MQDLRSRIGRTLSMTLVIYLIQALSLSTVYAAVISGDFRAHNVLKKTPLTSTPEETLSVSKILNKFESLLTNSYLKSNREESSQKLGVNFNTKFSNYFIFPSLKNLEDSNVDSNLIAQ